MQFMRPLDHREIAVFDDIHERGARVIPRLLTEQALAVLAHESEQLTWYQAPKQYGKNRVVHQDYLYAPCFPDDSSFEPLMSEVQVLLNGMLDRRVARPFEGPVRFNQARLQRYERCALGMGMHRDGDRCRNLVALFLLDSSGIMQVINQCGSRTNMLTIGGAPGDLILLRGNGFGGVNRQPLHCVRDVETRRTTFALRMWQQ